MKTVERDLYEVLKSGAAIDGIKISYGESFLEDESSELINIIVSSCQFNEDQVSGDITHFNQLVGQYEISIFITAGNYLRASELLFLVGDTLIQNPSEYEYYLESYSVDADSYVNHVQIELSVSTLVNFYNRA